MVANAAFFQAVYLDFKGSGRHSTTPTTIDSSLDERRPSRRPVSDEEEFIEIWKSTTFGVDGREFEDRDTPSQASGNGSIGEQRLVN